MEENKVEIDVQEYHELLRKEERIATLERLFKSNVYVNTEIVKSVLLIEDESVDGLLDELEKANARIYELESIIENMQGHPLERTC